MANDDDDDDADEHTALTVLVCSANVGNAEPTPESFGAWVPDDGDVSGPLSSTRHPVDAEWETEARDALRGCDGKFDVIVLGMQEAAFVDRSSKHYKDRESSSGNGGDGKEGGGDADRSERSEDGNDAAGGGKSERGEDGSRKTLRFEQFVNAKMAMKRIGTKKEAAESERGGGERKDGRKAGGNPLDPTAALDVVRASAEEAKKEGRRGKNKLARKAAKGNMVLRGIAATETYKSPTLRHAHGDGKDRIGENSAVRAGGSYDTRRLVGLAESRCPSYSMVTAALRGEMRLIVLARKDVAEEISDVHVAGENTGIGGVMANKGGIITTFTLRGTRLSFMTCHLEAHEGAAHLANRNKNLAAIFAGAKTDPNYHMHDATILSHHMFVCGDLNYRIKFGDGEDDGKSTRKKRTSRIHNNLTMSGIMKKHAQLPSKMLNGGRGGGGHEAPSERSNGGPDANIPYSPLPGGGDDGPAVEERGAANGSHFVEARELIDAEDWKALNDGDELAAALRRKECLVGFDTLPCNFPPTFKVARGEGYQYNEKRTPSYTDRILWKSAPGVEDKIIPFLYEPCPDFITSDHKPIRGGYLVKMHNGFNKMPPSRPSTTTKPSSSVKHNERQLHLLVSDMKCAGLPVMDNELMGGLADPYILFVSYPKQLLRNDHSWPSTKVVKRNLNPEWEHDNLLTLNDDGCRDRDGNVSLHGSMLYMTVMDEDKTTGDDVIGTVALSLRDLFSEVDARHDRKAMSSETAISRPILRDGLEYGTMECKILSAYLTEKEARAVVKKHGRKVRTKTRKNAITNKISALFHL